MDVVMTALRDISKGELIVAEDCRGAIGWRIGSCIACNRRMEHTDTQYHCLPRSKNLQTGDVQYFSNVSICSSVMQGNIDRPEETLPYHPTLQAAYSLPAGLPT